MKKRYIPLLMYGIALAAFGMVLQIIEYRYFIGSLDTKIYTSVVATIFTALGIWIGIKILRKKSSNGDHKNEIDHLKIKKLKLNDREYEILQLIAKGLSNQAIADKLFLALPTIKTHTSNLFSKLNVQSRTQAIHKAKSLNLI